MFVCKFEDGQGLGNQLWNYASIRSIAIKCKTKFGIINYEKFKGKDFLNIDGSKISELSNILKYKEELIFDYENNYISSYFDEKVYDLKGDWVLEGLFQSEKYLINSDKFLNQIIKLKNPYVDESKNIECVLNIRGGEYKKHNNFILPKSYWTNAMEYMKKKFSVSEFVVVSDDYEYSKYLFPDLKVIHNSIEDCYKSIFSAKNIVVSNSSFSYFPIKSSLIKKNVLAPYNWARFNSSKNFWCSPCNCYSDWNYLDRNGTIYSFKEASKNAEITQKKYANFPIYDEKKHQISKPFILKIIPQSLKRRLLYFLNKFFPSRF